MAGEFVPSTLYSASPISGRRDPQGNNGTFNKPQIDGHLKWLEPSVAPFVTLLANKKNQLPDVAGPIHKWGKKYPYPNVVTLAADATSGATTLTLQSGDGAKLAADYLLFNIRTEERIRVSSVSVDTPTVTRNLGSSGGNGMTAGDQLLILGPSREDGAGIGSIRSTLPVEDYNYLEITRLPFGLTGRMLNTEQYYGNDLENEQRDKWHEFAKMIERKYFFGVRDLRTGTLGNGQNTMGGCADFIRHNVWDLNGNQITQTSFNDFANEVMKYGAGGYIGGSGTPQKLLFGSRALFQVVCDWAGEKVRYAQNDKVVGMEIMKIQTAVGVITMFPSAIFDTVDALRNQAFVIDINEIAPANYKGRATRLLSDRQANDVDAREWELFNDSTLQFPIEEAHGRILNIGF